MQPLISAQNRDGGWGYRGGSSWTEPTSYALLALSREPSAEAAVRSGRDWLARNQRPDGGFAPRPQVEVSTWVTSLAVLAGLSDDANERRAVNWLLAQTGEESTLANRLRRWMLGQRGEYENTPAWSWYPGTAAWVAPTALTLLALRGVERKYAGARIRERINQGEKFLLSRRCEDGGWNHGSSRALGFQSVSYPETTGLALLALAGSGAHDLDRSFKMAEQHYRNCRSLEGLSWIELGFLAHTRPVPAAPAAVPARTLLDAALSILATTARQGRNAFLERA